MTDRVKIFFLIALVCLLPSCAAMKPILSPDPAGRLVGRGDSAMIAGKYEEALELYSRAEDSAVSRDVALRASYGRACALLARSGDAAAAEEGARLWKSWALRPEGGEDPRVMAPVVERVLEQEREAAALERERDALRREAAQLGKENEALRRETDELRENIKGLESVYREMRDRKMRLQAE